MSSAPRRFRLRATFFLVALSLPLSRSAAQDTTQAVATSNLNLRSGPRVTARRIGRVEAGDTIQLLGSRPSNDYVRVVAAESDTGWVWRLRLRFLSPSEASLSAPTTVTAARQDAWLEVHFVDVGQGDGIWIRTFDDSVAGNGMYEGRNIVIDGGPDASDDKNEMLRYLDQRYGRGGVIDALIVTHPHDDHYPGAEGVLRHFEVTDYYDPGFPKEGPKYNDFLQLVGSEIAGGGPIRLHIGEGRFGVLDWGRELDAEFLYSYPGPGHSLGSNSTLENNASIVLKLTYRDVSFLFMGDAEGKNRNDSPSTPKYAERLLLNEFPAEKLKSTVLKIAHHGSETSSTLPFIQAVDPDILLVLSGRRKYGPRFLPDRSTLQRYCTHNPQIRIYRTDQNDEAQGRGTSDDQDADHIVVRTNGLTVSVEAFAEGQPMPNPTSCSP
jgi:competence protein ComEC